MPSIEEYEKLIDAILDVCLSPSSESERENGYTHRLVEIHRMIRRFRRQGDDVAIEVQVNAYSKDWK